MSRIFRKGKLRNGGLHSTLGKNAGMDFCIGGGDMGYYEYILVISILVILIVAIKK